MVVGQGSDTGSEPEAGTNPFGAEPSDDRGATVRLCAVGRVERSISDLIRFVAGPDDVMVPDLNRKLPGRGVWVTADKASVAAAVKSQAFAKRLKRQVTVPEDLPDRIEAMLMKRLEQALAMANKAGVMVFGFAQVEAELDKCQIAVLVHGSDGAEGGRDKLDRKLAAIARAQGGSAAIVNILTIDQISLAMGRSNVVHAGLRKGGATDRVWSEAERIKRYQAGFGASA